MKVVSTAKGFDGVTVRNVGDEFDMPEGSAAPWFKSAEPPEVVRSYNTPTAPYRYDTEPSANPYPGTADADPPKNPYPGKIDPPSVA